MSTRDSLIAYLEPILAGTPGLEDINLVKSIRSVDRLSKPTMIVKTVRFQKLPAAPIGNMLGEFLLVLVSNHVDVNRAEDQLDELLEVLLPQLFNSHVVWTAADQTSFEEHVSYDIAVSNILK